MRHLIDLVKLDRLDHLIRRKATGTPKVLAQRMGISRSSLFDIISFLREDMRAPIHYSREQSSYVYKYPPKFHLGFEQDLLNEDQMYNVLGGIDDEPLNIDTNEYMPDMSIGSKL